jgi:hypothetical protein
MEQDNPTTDIEHAFHSSVKDDQDAVPRLETWEPTDEEEKGRQPSSLRTPRNVTVGQVNVAETRSAKGETRLVDLIVLAVERAKTRGVLAPLFELDGDHGVVVAPVI